MKKFYITKYIAVAATIEADNASEAVAAFEDAIDGIYTEGRAFDKGLSFGDSGEPATVKEYIPVVNVLADVGTIAGGEFVAHRNA